MADYSWREHSTFAHEEFIVAAREANLPEVGNGRRGFARRREPGAA